MEDEDIDIEGILEVGHGARSRRHALVELTEHAKKRCIYRNISQAKCIAAFQGGTVQEANQGRWMCTKEGVVIIVDESWSKILSTWNLPSHGIVLKKVHITSEMEQAHTAAINRARTKSTWTSHTVAVVDQSGSMRKVDTDNFTMRSDIVWLNLAVSLVAKGLRSGERTDTDMLSVVSMRDDSEVVIRHEPIDWILYNKLVDLLESSMPLLGGCYKPALETASALLSTCTTPRCALSLLFLSDGRPSDKMRRGDFGTWEEKMVRYAKDYTADLAVPLGRRLSICLVGIGGVDESEFRVLEAMRDEAKEYECPVVCESGCVSAAQLATALMTTASSTTTTKTHLESMAEGKIRPYIKKRLSEVGQDTSPTENWTIVHQQRVYDPIRDRMNRRIVRTKWTKCNDWVAYESKKTFLHVDAAGVAFENRWFGQGKERLAKEFREIDRNGQFVGPWLVAKASLMIESRESIGGKDTKKFHKKFFRTHLIATEAASTFNKILTEMDGTVSEMIFGTDNTKLPVLEFLQCHVYMLDLDDNNRVGYLVEPMLDIKKYTYQNFNGNEGSVLNFNKLSGRSQQCLGFKSIFGSNLNRVLLETIEEGDENDDGNCQETGAEELHSNEGFTIIDLLQTFSCFSYHFFRKKMLVCDLQGVFNTEKNLLQLTDPVVHQLKMRQCNQASFGRTDRGEAGIKDFKETHRCNGLCKLVQSALWMKRQQERQVSYRSFGEENLEFKARRRRSTWRPKPRRNPPST